MLKYRGQYHVVYEMDKRTGKPAESSYIPCRIKKGANICRHNNSILSVYILGIRLIHKLLKEYPSIFRLYKAWDNEGVLLFDESNMSEVARILKPIVQGKNTFPKSRRNIRFM